MTLNDRWTIEDSMHLYQIKHWGEGYFNIDSHGNLCVLPQKKPQGPTIKICDVIEQMKEQGVKFPCVIRFHDVLREQVKNLNETFRSTIQEAKYQGQYFGVYPIKVNQLREVVEEVIDAGQFYHYGLEAGSKAELLSAMAYNTNEKALTILNGYKDKEFFELAFMASNLKSNVFVVIEKFSELNLYLDLLDQYEKVPQIGLRVKLNTKGSGKWADSTGDKAKFGLSLSEILKVVQILKAKKKLHLLNLLHFHIGSQIPDIRTIKESLIEASRVYIELHKLQASIDYFDVGGGVGINYDGSRSSNNSSTNYNLKDYIGDVVYILKDYCNDAKVPHPHIVSETGRAVSAHHSCVVTNVFGNIEQASAKNLNTIEEDQSPLIIRQMIDLNRQLNLDNYQDIYNDACLIKEEAINGFKLGLLNLEQRAFVEDAFSHLCYQIIMLTENDKYVPNEIRKLKSNMAHHYLCNFSLFQSLPDTWAIKQVLPIVPLKKLNQFPSQEVRLADITCDSDGKIDQFIGPEGHRSSLKMHPLQKDDEYPIGFFLTGAYQDIMGDMHNLFGRVNEVHVYLDESEQNHFYIEEIIQGQTKADVLSIMQYTPIEMCNKIKKAVNQQVKKGHIRPKQGVKFVDYYEACMFGYTYLE